MQGLAFIIASDGQLHCSAISCELIFCSWSFMYSIKILVRGPNLGETLIWPESRTFPASLAIHWEWHFIQYWCDVKGTLIRQTLSKDLKKSKTMRSDWHPRSRPLAIYSNSWITLVSQDLLYLIQYIVVAEMLCFSTYILMEFYKRPI